MKCQVEVTPIQGIEAPLSVGQDFLLNCIGDWPRGIQPESVSLSLPPEAKYVLRMRSFELRSKTEADLKVLSYTPGRVQLPDLTLNTNQGEISLGPIEFEVHSVLVAPDPGKQPEPFGPIGPAIISWPWIYTILIVIFVLGAMGAVGSYFLRKWQRRRLLDQLQTSNSSQSPENQFYQNIRSLQRKNPLFFAEAAAVSTQGTHSDEALQALVTLEDALKTYLVRQFLIPAFHWKPNLICRDFLKQNRRYHSELSSQLLVLLNEFYKIKKTQMCTDIDAQTLFKKTQKWVDEVEKTRRRK